MCAVAVWLCASCSSFALVGLLPPLVFFFGAGVRAIAALSWAVSFSLFLFFKLLSRDRGFVWRQAARALALRLLAATGGRETCCAIGFRDPAPCLFL
ncbi:hypothetical protein [Pandoravirus japonicus]|uniref:Uncharacterized protein n=1 Tax=Pandoravirus japonicus TaxID=2823154 RepID=A0A811BSM2_9VIRU|nr:hypothetical protein [Pandoravirus japonicus]